MSKREQILTAAQTVVRQSGTDALTLEAVAKEAGVSKGGLLYHFPNKEALIQGMIQSLIDEFNAAVMVEVERDPTPDQAGRYARAYLRATFNSDYPLPALSEGILAAVALNPTLLRPLQMAFQAWQERLVNDGIDPALATVIRTAADGLWFAELMEFAPPAEPLRSAVYEMLLAMVRGKG
jgi:AcrR family transcriptional regulator